MIQLNVLAKDIEDNLGKLVKYYIATTTKWCFEIRRRKEVVTDDVPGSGDDAIASDGLEPDWVKEMEQGVVCSKLHDML